MAKTWENLRPASFRGVAFEVGSHSESGGRRVELHEYPLRDAPYAEDLGKKIVNGMSMLFYQAYFAECIYHGIQPDKDTAKALFTEYEKM